MDNIRQVAQKMTGDGIASWIIFACVVPVVCVLSIANPLPHDQSDPAYRIFAAALSSTTALGILILFWCLVLKKLSGWTRIALTFVAYACAGALKGVFQQWLLAAAEVGDWTGPVLISRVSVNSSEWIVVLGLLAFTVATNRDHYHQIQILQAQQAAVDDYLAGARSSVISDQDHIIRTVKATVQHDVDKLRDSNPHELIADTQKFVEETVRPLSYKLSQEIPNWSLPSIDSSNTKVSWLSYFRHTPIAGRLSPVWTTVALCVFAFGYVLSTRGFVGMLLTYVVLVPVLLCLLFIAQQAVKLFHPKSPREQFLLNIGSVMFLGFIPFVVSQSLGARDLFPTVASSVSFLILGLALLVLLSIGMACYEDQVRIDKVTCDLQNQLHWIEKRISVEMWAHHGRVARALHGPYQAAIYTYIHGLEKQLESGELTRADTETMANRLVTELENVLTADEEQQSVELALARIEAMWSDIAKIHYSYNPSAQKLVESDPALGDLASSLLHDGIVNAIRHGKATKIDIGIVQAQEFAVAISIDDNGEGKPEIRSDGLGTKQFEANSLEWELVTKPHGHTLRLVLPGGTSIEDALTRQREGVRELA